jgi:hypothetical protein
MGKSCGLFDIRNQIISKFTRDTYRYYKILLLFAQILNDCFGLIVVPKTVRSVDNMQHPKHLSGLHLDEYLSHLAVKRNLAINTQKTALNALVFMFKQFLGIEVGTLSFIPSSRPKTIPTVFSHDEAKAVINHLRN